MNFYSNIYVIKDPEHPENNGRTFLYRYGKKIFDKIKDKMEPEFEDEEPENPFDFWEGSNFRLKIRNVDGYRNYDKSEFDNPSPLFEDDSEIEKVWKSEYSLQEFVEPNAFKSYEELKARLDKVMGFDTADSELHRPGDVVGAQNTTAEEKVQKKVVKEETPTATPPKPEAPKETSPVEEELDNSDSSSEDDYFDDVLSKL